MLPSCLWEWATIWKHFVNLHFHCLKLKLTHVLLFHRKLCSLPQGWLVVQRLCPLQPQRGLVPRGPLQEQVPGWNILGWVPGRFLLLESSSNDDQTYRLRRKIPQCDHIEFSVFELQKNKILLFNHCFAQPAPAKSRSTVFLSFFPYQVPLSFIRTLLYCDSVFFKTHIHKSRCLCLQSIFIFFFSRSTCLM